MEQTTFDLILTTFEELKESLLQIRSLSKEINQQLVELAQKTGFDKQTIQQAFSLYKRKIQKKPFNAGEYLNLIDYLFKKETT